MEIIKRNINMNHICGKNSLQITLDDDINVPDTKPDIYKKIIENGEIIIENLRPGDERAGVSGKLKFNMLYQTEKGDRLLDSIEGTIGFNESINIPGVFSGDMVKCNATLEDLTVNLINSRKISVSAIVTLEVYGENTYVNEAAAEISDPSSHYMKKNLEILSLIENKRDILRVREQHELSSNKPNMGNIVWSVSELRNLEMKAAGDELIVKGEMYVFAMYSAEGSEDNIQYVEEVMPFTGKLPLAGAKESLIADVSIVPSQKIVSIKPDNDGEPRVLEAEMVLDLDIKLYEEQNLSLVTDVYSTKKNVAPVFQTAKYDSLLIHNHTRCRMGDKFKLGDKEQILQIINSTANITMDDIAVTESGLRVEGAANVRIMYISSNDSERIGCTIKEVPFSQQIDAAGISEDCFYTVKSTVEQLNTTMLGSDELEIKITAGLDALILKPMETEVITDIMESPLDYNELRKMPGISGCITRQGESLWDIAKRHHTTMEKIMAMNNLSSENIKAGTKLLIIKEAAN